MFENTSDAYMIVSYQGVSTGGRHSQCGVRAVCALELHQPRVSRVKHNRQNWNEVATQVQFGHRAERLVERSGIEDWVGEYDLVMPR